MNPEFTQPSLLSRVRDPGNQAAWVAFESKYRELVLRFCRRRGLQQTDAEDVLQIVMSNLLQSLPKFVYDAKRGRFRDYLYQVVRSGISRLKGGGSRPKTPVSALDTSLLESLHADEDSAAEVLWNQEWINHHYRLAMESIRQSFEPRSIDVFERSVRGESVAQLAAAFEMSEQAVHKVRQRIRTRMEELITQQVRDEEVSADDPSA